MSEKKIYEVTTNPLETGPLKASLYLTTDFGGKIGVGSEFIADFETEEKANSVCAILNQSLKSQPGAVWVKATRQNMRRSAILRDSVLPENHIHQWVVNGWDEKGVLFTNKIFKEWWELEILDEGTAAGREEDAVKAHFDNWHRWLSDNGYTYDGEYYYDEDNNFFKPDQLYELFKQKEK